MKLKLESQGDIAILDVMEDVSPQNIQVLKAGIAKLLQTGHGKIVLNIAEVKDLSMPLVHEMLSMNATVESHNGVMAIVGHTELVAKTLKYMVNPPQIGHFHSLNAAIKSLRESEALLRRPGKTTLDGQKTELRQRIRELEEENKALKSRLVVRDNRELMKLRAENGLLQKQITVMDEQLRMLLRERKKAYELETVDAKVDQLETTLVEALTQQNLLGKPAT